MFTLCTIRFSVSKFCILPTQCVRMFHMVPEICSITCMVFMMDSQYVYCVVPTESYSVSFFFIFETPPSLATTHKQALALTVWSYFLIFLRYISIHEMSSLVTEDHRWASDCYLFTMIKYKYSKIPLIQYPPDRTCDDMNQKTTPVPT